MHWDVYCIIGDALGCVSHWDVYCIIVDALGCVLHWDVYCIIADAFGCVLHWDVHCIRYILDGVYARDPQTWKRPGQDISPSHTHGKCKDTKSPK